jgi:CPA2 family monovalent cation:H+ antiporter-2
MLIAETEYRYQVEEDIKPFRDVLLGLFFIVVGTALDLSAVAANFGWVLLLVVVPLLCKLLVTVAVARFFGAPLATSLRTGIYLAQVGELALVMLAPRRAQRRRARATSCSPVLAAMIISMCAAPLVDPVRRAARAQADGQRLARPRGAGDADRRRSMARQDHIIVCGYGRSGQNLARLLEAEDIPYVAIESDPAAGAGSFGGRLAASRTATRAGARRWSAQGSRRRARWPSRSRIRRSRSRSCITSTRSGRGCRSSCAP